MRPINTLTYTRVHSFLAERYLANDFKQMVAPPELPEWKRVSFGGVKASYGKKTQLSLLEQRQSLPIYKLKTELVEVRTIIYAILCDKLQYTCMSVIYLISVFPLSPPLSRPLGRIRC